MDGKFTSYSSNLQRDRLRRSLEETISDTNRVLAKWASTMRISNRYVITNDDIKSAFNGFLKRVLKYHFNDDIEVSRLISWHKPYVVVDENFQIIEIKILPMRDIDHPFSNKLIGAISQIDFTRLHVKVEPINKTSLSDVSSITFDSIEKITF